MKRLLCLLATLPLVACDKPQPPAAASSPVSERRIAELESRLDTLETMIRALDRRDDRLADLASNAASTRPAPRARAGGGESGETSQRLREIGDDLAGLDRRMVTLTEQMGAVAEGMAEINVSLQTTQDTLANHEQVIERLISGN
jgi:prefoldin subunit 5